MKNHVKIYLDYFGYDTTSYIECEICGRYGVDIHHIDARGMGGKNKEADRIENLMCLCRQCHERYGDIKELKSYLHEIHKAKMGEV